MTASRTKGEAEPSQCALMRATNAARGLLNIMLALSSPGMRVWTRCTYRGGTARLTWASEACSSFSRSPYCPGQAQ